MTARHKQASECALAGTPLASANGSENGAGRSGPLAWEDWFRHAGPQQRALALGLARQQGFLYAHQLPAVSNGKTPTVTAESHASTLLARILHGKVETFPPLADLPLCCLDGELDDVQQQAVLRALATPDIFLLQGLPGTGKSRVLAEIIRQAARRGWRTLLLAGHTASLDVVLERLVGKTEVLALRLLEAAEKLESLPVWLRGLTLDEQKKAFCERVQAGARGNRDQVEAACQRYGEQGPLWLELQACADRCRQLQARRQRLLDLQQLIEAPAPVQADAESDDALKAPRAAIEQCDQDLARLSARIAALEPGYLAKKHGRFWTLAFWGNLFTSRVLTEMEGARGERAEAQKRKDALLQEIVQVERQQAELRDRRTQERTALLAAEPAADPEAIRGELDALEEDQRRLDHEWTERCRCLGAESIARTSEAIAAAQQAWQRRKLLGEEECQFAHQWAKFIEESAPHCASQLASFANLLAGTAARWHTDAGFRDAVAPFDLVIVEDADTFSDADVLRLSRQGTRCLLVAPAIMAAPPALEKPSRPTAANLAASACWRRLWQALGGDAGCWPHVWLRDGDRLVCQLTPLAAEDRQHLEHESLADAPDIELGILQRPSARPCLAQVTFGPNITFADAFAFMVREVQEFPVQPLGRTAWWREDDRRVCRHLGPANSRVQTWLDIEPGLRLGATADGGGEPMRIAAIEFDKSAGWDRAKADAWLAHHRPIRDHERTVHLQTCYRFQHSLAKVVCSVVRNGEWLSNSTPRPGTPESGAGGERSDLPSPTGRGVGGEGSEASGFEFIPVPAAPKPEPAGLELDLSAPRSADKLPTGLRHGLPTRGFVNYLEAQALIRRLEAFSQQEAADTCRVAVLALYEGQAILLRRLVEQSEILRARRHPLEIALPSRLHQRECDVVFLSLTRSHPHRVTAFGADVRELPIALTRARTRLFVFGDLGALCHRLACNGTLEPHAAQQEHEHLSRLLAFVQPQFHAAANGVAKANA